MQYKMKEERSKLQGQEFTHLTAELRNCNPETDRQTFSGSCSLRQLMTVSTVIC